MQNAHARFGTLAFVKHTKNTATRVSAPLDRAVLEIPKDGRGQSIAHLLSVIGNDSEIGALWAGVAEGALFQVQLPDQAATTVSLGAEAVCFRGTVALANRERPVRHLVAISSELAKTKPGADAEGTRTVVCDEDPAFVLYRVAARFGLPVAPAWSQWFVNELKRLKALRPLVGLGCAPVLVNGNRATFLKSIETALKSGAIEIPAENGPIVWNVSAFPHVTSFNHREPNVIA